jgi:hypothetical protein
MVAWLSPFCSCWDGIHSSPYSWYEPEERGDDGPGPDIPDKYRASNALRYHARSGWVGATHAATLTAQ